MFRFFGLFLSSVLFSYSFCQSEEKIECSTFYSESDLESFSHSEVYDIIHRPFSKSEDLKFMDWKWEELGPFGTPPEGKESRALPSYSLGRGNGSGRINALYVNPQNERQIFACSPTGGLYYSENQGESWANAGTDHLPICGVSSVTVNPNDEANWIITTGDGDDRFMFSGGVFRTFDKGENWENISGTLDFKLPVEEGVFDFFISEIVSHPCDFRRQFLATSQGLYTSSNSHLKARKVNWHKESNERIYDIEVSDLDQSLVAAGGEHLWLSSNCGRHWEKINRPVEEDDDKYGLFRLSIEFSRTDPNKLYVAVVKKKELGGGGIGKGQLYSYDLEAMDWTHISDLGKFGNLIPTRGRAFEISPVTDSLMLIGNVQPVRISTDGGKTFQKIEGKQMHDDIHDFEFLSDGKTVLASTDGGVSISFDSGWTWEVRDKGVNTANVHGVSVAQSTDDVILYGGYDTGCTLLENGEWKHVSFGDGFETAISDSAKIVSMQNGRLYKSDDLAETNKFHSGVKKKGFKASWHTWLLAHSDKENTLYKSGSQVARTLDFGENWEIILDPTEYSSDVQKIWRVYQTDGFPNTLYAVGLGKTREDDRIFFTKNANEENPSEILWEILPKCPIPGWVESIIHSDECSNCHTLAFNSYNLENKILYFDGTRYSDITNGLGYASVRSGVKDKETGTMYFGTRNGLICKKQHEEQWTVLQGLPTTRIRSLKINYVMREIVIGTFGRGIWKAKLVS